MKFLCVSCDAPMKLKEVVNQKEISSLSVVYECQSCLQEVAMLTNPAETQLISSLGVTIDPNGAEASNVSKCPFASMFQNSSAASPEHSSQVQWNEEATKRLANIPEFFRDMAIKGIEKYATEQGHKEITVSVLEAAKNSLV